MKKLGISLQIIGVLLIIIALLMSCGGEETISEKETRLAKEKAKQGLIDVPVTAENGLIDVPTSVGIAPVEETIEKVVHVTYTCVPTDSSYWYVIMSDEGTEWHGTVKLATPYFDFMEARNQFKKSKGECYFHTFIQINKECIPTFDKHHEKNKSLKKE